MFCQVFVKQMEESPSMNNQLSRILPLKLLSWIAFSFRLYYAPVFNKEFIHSLIA